MHSTGDYARELLQSFDLDVTKAQASVDPSWGLANQLEAPPLAPLADELQPIFLSRQPPRMGVGFGRRPFSTSQ